MSEATLFDLVEQVQSRRRVLAVLKLQKAESLQRWEIAEEELLANERAFQKAVDEAEAMLRAAALEFYLKTGSKAPCPGVDIRVVTRVDFDPKVALKWAKEHDWALKLDEGEFKKLAVTLPEGQVPARISSEATVTIAQDLEKALANAERK